MGNGSTTVPMKRIDKGYPRILLPAGIGDVYWTMVKFESFCRSRGLTDVHVATVTGPEQYQGSLLRSVEFVEMMPFVKVDDPPTCQMSPIYPVPKWLHNIYLEMWHGTRTYYPGLLGFDYMLVYNSAINRGVFLEDVDQLTCNWYFPLTVSEEQERFRNQCREKYGKYAVFLWSFCYGGYSDLHLKEFPVASIIESTKKFVKKTGLTPIFVGAWWDTQFANRYLYDVLENVPGSVSLIGQTSLDQLFGCMKGSEIVVGCHCGPTVMAAVFHKKTIILWAKASEYGFNVSSPLAVCPPDTRGTTYWPLFTDELTVDKFAGKMAELYEQQF